MENFQNMSFAAIFQDKRLAVVSVALMFFLFPQSLWAALRGDLMERGIVIIGVQIGEREGPEAVVYAAMDDYPLEVTWYRADVGTVWSGEGTPPSEVSTLRTETFDEPFAVEEEEGYSLSNLEGYTFDGAGELWVRCVSRLGESIVFQSGDPIPAPVEGELPVFRDWSGVTSSFPVGYTLSGDYTDGALSIEDGGLPISATFYKGETGDVSFPLGTSIGNPSGGQAGLSLVFFPRITLQESLKVWARVSNGIGSIDTPAVILSVLVLTEDPEFVDWYSVVSGINSGATIELNAKLDVDPAIFEFYWYWGESGDTSEAIEIPAGLIGSSWIYFPVPSEERRFWVRAIAGATSVDSPTAILRPIPLAVPSIVDEPDDDYYYGPSAVYGEFFYLVAMGGNLQFEWFYGESGDESEPATASLIPGGNGRRVGYGVLTDDEHRTLWCKVSNEMGSVNSRTVRLHDGDIDGVDITFQKQISRLTIRDYVSAGGRFTSADMFNFQATFRPDRIDLYRITDDGPAFQGSDSLALGYEIFPRSTIRWTVSSSNDTSFDYATGTYRLRLYYGDEYLESEDLSLINEVADPELAEERDDLVLLSLSGAATLGGLLEAYVSMPTDYLPDTLTLLAVVDGQWEEVPYEQFPDYYYNASQSTDWDYYREDILKLHWQPNDSPYYWLTVERENGSTAVVRLPGSSGGEAVELPSSGDPFEIVLPKGMENIPLPKLPDMSGWAFGGADSEGPVIELPVELSDLYEVLSNLRPIAAGETGANSVGVVVRIDGAAAPLLEDAPTQLVVDEAGRILWCGQVEGDVFETRMFDLSGDGEVLLKTFVGKWTTGLLVPEGVDRVRLEWDNEAAVRSLEAPVVRLPDNFTSALGAERVDNDMAFSPKLGAFIFLRSYPWTFHGELGWTYLRPAPVGFHFFGLLADNGGGWFWTSPDVYPFIYSFRTSSWEYYLTNSYGWIYNFGEGAWRKVAL